MSEWTPGPWEVDHHEDTWFVPTIQGQTTEANARLIAAAPEMAELLTEWASSPSYRPIRDSFEDDVKVLLARIKGES